MTQFFHRKELAQKMAKSILTTSTINASSSGLFVAAPRRTGKSTFMREDIRPVLENMGALVLYADLWADKKIDPGIVITSAIKNELIKHEGVITRIARASGMDKVGIGGFTFAMDRIGLGKDISISQALVELSDESKKMIVLIIDEAQHAITTENGSDALFALKAARDELNSSKHYGLRIIATGSNRDKLAMLRSSKDQAFFGAPIVPFPHLDEKYVHWFCDNVGLSVRLDPIEVFKLFEKASFRPEVLAAATETIRLDFFIQDEDIAARFKEEVEIEIQSSHKGALRVIRGLTPLQSSVLCVMAASGDNYAPFEANTVKMYQDVLKSIDPQGKIEVDVGNVQQALIALQEKNLVWKASRGVYSIEENVLIDILDKEGMLDVVPNWNADTNTEEKIDLMNQHYRSRE